MERVIPELDKDDVLRIDYGVIYTCPRSGTKVESYHFRVYGEENNFYSNGNGNGYIGYARKFGGYEPFETARNAYDIYPVVDNWQYIKSTILDELAERRANKKTIYEFQI